MADQNDANEHHDAPEPNGPEPTMTVVAAPAPPVVPKPESRPEPITLTAEQLERYRTAERERDALKAAEETRAEEARKADELRLIEEGKLKEVIADKEKRIEESRAENRKIHTEFKATTLDSQLAVALSNHKLTKGSSAQLLKLWRDELVVEKDAADGTWKARSRDGRPVEQFVAENLANDDFAKFVQPTTTGGAPRSNASSSPAPKPVERPDPERRQVESLKASLGKRPTSRLNGTPLNN